MDAAARHADFAKKLRSARLRVGKSQEQIAAEIGTSRRHYIRWEQGHHIPTAEFMTRIGEATGQPDAFAPAAPVSPGDDEEDDSVQPLARDLAEVLQAEVRRQVKAALEAQDSFQPRQMAAVL